VVISALSGLGLDTLVAQLKHAAGMDLGSDALSARSRHLEALGQVENYLSEAGQLMLTRGTPELVAEELRRAQLALGDIVGVESSEELLGRIFSSFCIGK